MKLLYSIGFILAALLATDTAFSYLQISRFPDQQRLMVESWVETGNLPKCDPSGLTDETGQSPIDDTPLAIGICFSHTYIDEQIISASPNKPELDQVYFHLSCATDNLSARFQIILGRTDYRVWCQYALGSQLDDVPEFNILDAAIPPEPAGLIDRILSRIAD